MASINSSGYVQRKTRSGRKNPTGKGTVRNWWLIKENSTIGRINISVPESYIGKRIRLKLEVVEDEIWK